MTEKQLITLCTRGDRKAQRIVYEKYAPKMFGICRRYMKQEQDAEDAMLEGFFKVFSKIDRFKSEGSFEGWIRRIMINECLMKLRKHNMNLSVELNESQEETHTTAQHQLEAEDIMRLLDKLPVGYRTIFNLYAIEGYKHREIAEMLDISINTAKSQMIKARKKLQEMLNDTEYRVA